MLPPQMQSHDSFLLDDLMMLPAAIMSVYILASPASPIIEGQSALGIRVNMLLTSHAAISHAWAQTQRERARAHNQKGHRYKTARFTYDLAAVLTYTIALALDRAVTLGLFI